MRHFRSSLCRSVRTGSTATSAISHVAAVLLVKVLTRSTPRKKLGNDLSLTNKTTTLWPMCHCQSGSFRDPRFRAKCCFDQQCSPLFENHRKVTVQKIAKPRNEKEGLTWTSSEENFLLDKRKCAFHVRQAMLGALASFLIEA